MVSEFKEVLSRRGKTENVISRSVSPSLKKDVNRKTTCPLQLVSIIRCLGYGLFSAAGSTVVPIGPDENINKAAGCFTPWCSEAVLESSLDSGVRGLERGHERVQGLTCCH